MIKEQIKVINIPPKQLDRVIAIIGKPMSEAQRDFTGNICTKRYDDSLMVSTNTRSNSWCTRMTFDEFIAKYDSKEKLTFLQWLDRYEAGLAISYCSQARDIYALVPYTEFVASERKFGLWSKMREGGGFWQKVDTSWSNFLETCSYEPAFGLLSYHKTDTKEPPKLTKTKEPTMAKKPGRIYNKDGTINIKGVILQLNNGCVETRPFVLDAVAKEVKAVRTNIKSSIKEVRAARKAAANRFDIVAVSMLDGIIASVKNIHMPFGVPEVADLYTYKKYARTAIAHDWIAEFLTQENMANESTTLFKSKYRVISIKNGHLCYTGDGYAVSVPVKLTGNKFHL